MSPRAIYLYALRWSGPRPTRNALSELSRLVFYLYFVTSYRVRYYCLVRPWLGSIPETIEIGVCARFDREFRHCLFRKSVSRKKANFTPAVPSIVPAVFAPSTSAARRHLPRARARATRPQNRKQFDILFMPTPREIIIMYARITVIANAIVRIGTKHPPSHIRNWIKMLRRTECSRILGYCAMFRGASAQNRV